MLALRGMLLVRMPELPDIDTYCHVLRARVVGQPLTRVELLSPFVLRTVTPAPAAAEGRVVSAVSRLGKRVVLTFERELHFVIHLMIAGRLRFDATGPGSKPLKALSPRAGALFALHFPTGRLSLGEISKKKRAKLHVVEGAAALHEHDPGGVEPLEVDLATFRAALTAENHTIKRALTDPRVLSGIGNAYSDEILHRAQLTPVRWTTRLTDGDFERLKQSFVDFLHNLPFYGLAVVCVDDPVIRGMLPEIARPTLTYGLAEDADVQVLDFVQTSNRSRFRVRRKDTGELTVTLNLPGIHNALNAAAAIAVATEDGIGDEAIIQALAKFEGVGRRFQQYGEFETGRGKAMLVDDYGHHPSEVKVTINAARAGWPPDSR